MREQVDERRDKRVVACQFRVKGERVLSERVEKSECFIEISFRVEVSGEALALAREGAGGRGQRAHLDGSSAKRARISVFFWTTRSNLMICLRSSGSVGSPELCAKRWVNEEGRGKQERGNRVP